MRLRRTLIVAILALTIPNVVVAESAFLPFVATYRVKMRGLRGEMQMSLKRNDESYSAVSTVRPRGLARIFFDGTIVDKALFSISDGSLVPRHFESVDAISRHDKSVSMDFDYPGQRAVGTLDGEPFEIPLQPDAFDRVSLQYALMLSLSSHAHPALFTMFDNAKSSPLKVTYKGSDSIKVPYGRLAIQFVQHEDTTKGRITSLWCAETLRYLPVRIEQYRNGKLALRAELIEYQKL